MNNAHIIAIPFTGVGLHGGFRGNAWFRHRIEIFKNHTLRSLANQSNKDFILWLWFRNEEYNNPLIKDLTEAIAKTGLPAVFTFEGLMYHDDKFTKYTLKNKLKNCFQMVWDGYRTGEKKSFKEIWKYTWEDKNKTLLSRLGRALEALPQEQYDWVYLTRLDSDDMFHEDAVDLIQSAEPAYKKALVFDKGYMYNVETMQLAEWLPPTNPPFHTIIFPGSIFFNPKRHLEYYGEFKSHEDIPLVFDTETLDMYRYCVTAHGKHHISTAWDVPLPKRAYQKLKYAKPYCYTTSGRNISTHWQSKLRKRKNFMLGYEFKNEEEKLAILKQFGL